MSAKHPLTIQLVIFSILSLILVSLLGNALPPAVDWETAFKPAVWKLLQGQSPYRIEGYFNAPWTLLPLIPLVLLPESIGRAAHAVITLAAFAYTAYKLGAKPLAMVILLLSPPVMHGLLNGNIDWLAVLGFVLPPQIGLFFITTKPQIGIAVGLYWLVDIWLQQGWVK